ncbi:MAG: hypothetical protein ACRCUZ_13535 [Shewanella sp.]
MSHVYENTASPAGRAVALMLRANDELLACRLELVEIRREGARRFRASDARCLLSLCRLNRALARAALAALRQLKGVA